MVESATMTRDEARAMFQAAGLSYACITRESLQRLRGIIDQRMRDSGLIRGSFRCRQRVSLQETANGRYGEIRCRAHYFDSREAVTFNDDGFIGFAGWADPNNVQPILCGFADWVRELSAEPAEADFYGPLEYDVDGDVLDARQALREFQDDADCG